MTETSRLKEIVQPELTHKERLLWVGRPARFPLVLLGWFTLFCLILWLPLFLYILVVTGSIHDIISAGTPIWVLTIFGIIVGFSMLRQAILQVFGPSRDVYALTSKRGIIIRNFIQTRVSTLSPETLRSSHRKGKGKFATLDFYPERSVSSIFLAEHDLTAFRNIKDYMAVEALIQKTFSQETPP